MKTSQRIDNAEKVLARAHRQRPVPAPTPGWQARVMSGLRAPATTPADQETPLLLRAAWASTAVAFCIVMLVVLAGWHQPTDSLAWLWLEDAISTQSFFINL